MSEAWAEKRQEAGTHVRANERLSDPLGGASPLSRTATLGLYLATCAGDDSLGPPRRFANSASVERAYEHGLVRLRARIRVGECECTVGELLVRGLMGARAAWWPACTPFDFNRVEAVFRMARRALLAGEHAALVRGLEEFGARVAERSGFSICGDTFAFRSVNAEQVAAATTSVAYVEEQYLGGVITDGERVNKSVDLWAEAEARAGFALRDACETRGPGSVLHGLLHGTKGGWLGLRASTLASSLWSRRDGSICELAVRNSLAEGRTAHELAIIAEDRRRRFVSRADTHERAAALAYEVAKAVGDVRVVTEDCGASAGQAMRRIEVEGHTFVSLAERIRGRALLVDVRHPQTSEVLAVRGVEVGREAAEAIERAGIEQTLVRWPVACRARGGVCAACVGRGARRGDRVGYEAAFELAKNAPSLRPRSYYIGGGCYIRAERSTPPSWSHRERVVAPVRAHFGVRSLGDEGLARTPDGLVVMDAHAVLVVRGEEVAFEQVIPLERGDVLACEPGVVEAGALIARRHRAHDAVIAAIPEGVTAAVLALEEAASKAAVVLGWGDGETLRVPVEHIVSPCFVVSVGQRVRRGEMLALPRSQRPWHDRAPVMYEPLETLEAQLRGRGPRAEGPVAPHAGFVRVCETAPRGPTPPWWMEDRRGRVPSVIEIDDGERCTRVFLPPGAYTGVGDGSWVEPGEALGSPQTHPGALLHAMGREAFCEQFVDTFNAMFIAQGLPVDEAYLALVARALVSRVRVTDPGDTHFAPRSFALYDEVREANEGAVSRGARPARYEPVLTGLSALARWRRARRAPARQSPAPMEPPAPVPA